MKKALLTMCVMFLVPVLTDAQVSSIRQGTNRDWIFPEVRVFLPYHKEEVYLTRGGDERYLQPRLVEEKGNHEG